MSAADRTAPAVLADTGGTARAETVLPLAPAALTAFVTDVGRLFRLNPALTIERWQPDAGGFCLVADNASNGRRVAVRVFVERTADGSSLLLRYAGGLKRATLLTVEPLADGARLVVAEFYPNVAGPDDPCLADVDRSLVPWVAALRRHLIARRRWGWLPGWRWWNERVMPGLAPAQRRIVRLLVWTGVVEFAFFLGLVLVWRATDFR